MDITYNLYFELAKLYDAQAERLARIANTKDEFDADKLKHQSNQFLMDAESCRAKAKDVVPVANSNDNPTLAKIEKRVALVGNLQLRQYDGGYALLDVATQQFLPPMPMPLTLKEVAAILDASGVANVDDNTPMSDDELPF